MVERTRPGINAEKSPLKMPERQVNKAAFEERFANIIMKGIGFGSLAALAAAVLSKFL